MKPILDLLTPFHPSSLKTRDETIGQSSHSWLHISQDSFEKKIVLIGVPDDRGVLSNQGNPGAKEGPSAFRKAFYSLYDRPGSHALGPKIMDAGNIALGDDVSSTHEKLAQVVAFFLSKKVDTIVVIGGGHDFSFGSYKGLQENESQIVPIINFDAHLDLRPTVGGQINSGTPFSRIIEHFPSTLDSGRALLEVGIQQERNPASLFEFAKNHNVKVVEFKNQKWIPRDIAGQDSSKTQLLPKKPLDFIQDHLRSYRDRNSNHRLRKLHISLDLDVFSSWIAPGTSASTPFGCPVEDIVESIETLMSASGIRLLDIAELCPSRDFNGQTARLAASLVYRALCVLP